MGKGQREQQRTKGVEGRERSTHLLVVGRGFRIESIVSGRVVWSRVRMRHLGFWGGKKSLKKPDVLL